MDVRSQFRSLTQEIVALRDRIREFYKLEDSKGPHWPTDGEWKESVLRTILRRHLPSHLEPVRGFVVTREKVSTQIDVLIYDNRKPVLFRDGDLVFVTPDAVQGVVEVKSRINGIAELEKIIKKLSDNVYEIRKCDRCDEKFSDDVHEIRKCDRCGEIQEAVAAIFAFESDIDQQQAENVLGSLSSIASGEIKRAIDFLCLGNDIFTLFHEEDPDSKDEKEYNSWHFYYLQSMAPAYFISNIIYSFSVDSVSSNMNSWFPIEKKETLSTRKLDLK